MNEMKGTASERVIAMRDDFKLLAEAYLKAGAFAHAKDAIVLAEALEKFEDDHNITEVAWPPEPLAEPDSYNRQWLVELDYQSAETADARGQ